MTSQRRKKSHAFVNVRRISHMVVVVQPQVRALNINFSAS